MVLMDYVLNLDVVRIKIWYLLDVFIEYDVFCLINL